MLFKYPVCIYEIFKGGTVSRIWWIEKIACISNMNKDFFLRIWNIVRYFSSNESKFIYECIDKPTKKPSTCSVIATCKTETTIYHFSDKIHHVLKQQIQFQQLFQGREWWDNLNAPKNFHVTKDFLKMLNFFTHKSGFCWYRKFDNCVYLEECILCKTVKAFFFYNAI